MAKEDTTQSIAKPSPVISLYVVEVNYVHNVGQEINSL